MLRRSAFTAIELMLALVVIAILTIAALPEGDARPAEEGLGAARTLEGDIAYARNLCIARPDQPVVLRVDTAANKYWLARASSPDNPIAHPQSGRPYVVQFGPGGDKAYEHVKLWASDLGASGMISFDSMGNTAHPSGSTVQLMAGEVAYELSVSPVAAECSVHEGFTKNLPPVSPQEPEPDPLLKEPDVILN
jgi:prepilin-type N-terminal cleavage/methylation domain-containing protein